MDCHLNAAQRTFLSLARLLNESVCVTVVRPLSMTATVTLLDAPGLMSHAAGRSMVLRCHCSVYCGSFGVRRRRRM